MANPLFRKKSIEKIIADAEQEGLQAGNKTGLKKVLTVKDLTFMGIAAVVGAGVFSTIGTAAFNGGPGISLLFVFTAITCGFAALCYAEFASRVPLAGSAYTYAYVTFGELVAWIIGWALILEYTIGNIVVAISWSGYFNNLLEGVTNYVQGLGYPDFDITLPPWLTVDPATANMAYNQAKPFVDAGQPLDASHQFAFDAYTNAPVIGGEKLFINLPAFLIVALITAVTYVGIKESKQSTNAMVIFKVAVILFVIVLGFFSVNPHNWSPFMPNGLEGVLRGVSAVFYAYIGFDALSTTAEECKNPQRDLPRGMIYSLIICTGLYILIALVLTGMVNYTELNVTDPLAEVFNRVGKEWIGYIVSISAVVATTSVLLVFQLGQPRIWMSMSRDGLLPKVFGLIHKKYQTPYFSTIVTGLMVSIPALFMQSNLMTDLTSIGTLFAFVIVSAGVLLLPAADPNNKRSFKLPYINGKFIVPVLVGIFVYFSFNRFIEAITHLGSDSLQEILFLLYVALAVTMAILSFVRNYSLIPIMGVLFCAYLLIEIPAQSWIWFFVWMSVGLLIYFLYGRRKSKLARERQVVES